MVMEYGSIGYADEDTSCMRGSNIYSLGSPFIQAADILLFNWV